MWRNSVYFLLGVCLISVVNGWIWRLKTGNARYSLVPVNQDIDVNSGDDFIISFNVAQKISNTYDVKKCVNITLTSEPREVTTLPSITLCLPHPDSVNFTLHADHAGQVTIIPESSDEDFLDVEEAYVRVAVSVNDGLNIAGDILGWVYTIAWDISFLPQIIHNWRRHSVDGLSFDFLTLNFIGFFCYFIFNIGLYASDKIKDTFVDRNPYDVLHVRLNDVIFPAYALLCTMVQIAQCFVLKRSPGQRVSTTCRIISGLLICSVLVGVILVPTVESILWLDLLYWCSYVKLFISTIKYFPQLYVNYKTKSTRGWSIWQVILDFVGGSFSLIQMFLLAANFDDWNSVLTDPTKLGLGCLSIVFNIFFFIQHYCLYRNNDSKADETKDDKISAEDTAL